jgi:hypothetical protein
VKLRILSLLYLHDTVLSTVESLYHVTPCQATCSNYDCSKIHYFYVLYLQTDGTARHMASANLTPVELRILEDPVVLLGL